LLPRLQKSDKDTNELIEEVTKFLFSVGVRTSRERAWAIFEGIHKLPYKLMVKKNPVIKYQGQGNHISSKHGSQLLTIKNVGRFELKGVSSRKDQKKTASITFVPSADIRDLVSTIEVLEEDLDNE